MSKIFGKHKASKEAGEVASNVQNRAEAGSESSAGVEPHLNGADTPKNGVAGGNIVHDADNVVLVDSGPFKVATALAGQTEQQPVDMEELRKKRIFVHGDDKEAKIAISAYKSLRTRVLQRLDEMGTNSLMVTGAAQNVGKTLTAINFAIALSRRSGKQIVLVDMDLRSPSVHHLFGLKPRGNLVDVADGELSVQQALIDSGIKNLRILPGTNRMEDSSEALSTPQMQALLDEFKAQKDALFVFDTPPVLGCDDVTAVAPLMDACLFVVNERNTSKKELENAMRVLDERVPMVGIMINRSSEANFSSYYY